MYKYYIPLLRQPVLYYRSKKKKSLLHKKIYKNFLRICNLGKNFT